MQFAFDPEEVVQAASAAVASRTGPASNFLDDLSGALYVTDTEGVITHFNKACIGFAGRVPVINRDRWCVTWRLFREDDSFLPHDQCPMAVAIQQCRPVRGTTAIARRPDGTRVSFIPYPTPVFDAAGVFVGGVNLLFDITGDPERERWLQEARRCHRLAQSIADPHTIQTLKAMATEYEERARECVVGRTSLPVSVCSP